MVMIDPATLHKSINVVIGEGCESYSEIIGDQTIYIPAEKLIVVVTMLIDRYDSRHLSGITAQIREEDPGVIQLLYHFWIGRSFSLMIDLPRQSPKCPEITSLLPGADFYEREVAEMFGVEFTGRGEIPPLLLPDDWDQGPPFNQNEVSNE